MEGYRGINEKLNIARDKYASIHDLKKLAQDGNWQVRFAVACNSSATSDILLTMVSDTNISKGVLSEALLHAIAGNCNATPEMLSQLSNHTNWIIRQAVGRNRSTSISILEKLASDSSEDVRKALQYNPTISNEIRMMLKLQE